MKWKKTISVKKNVHCTGYKKTRTSFQFLVFSWVFFGGEIDINISMQLKNYNNSKYEHQTWAAMAHPSI